MLKLKNKNVVVSKMYVSKMYVSKMYVSKMYSKVLVYCIINLISS